MVSSWFFGGGTPSLVTPDYLRDVLSLLPGIKERGEKTIEIHPAKFNLELLDILQKYNFQNIIIGVQSFTPAVLKKTKRLVASKAEIEKIIREIHKRQMHAWLDIVGFLSDDPEEASVFRQDIKLALELNPDEISIAINYFYKNKYLNTGVAILTAILSQAQRFWLTDLAGDCVSTEAIKLHFQRRRNVRLFNKQSSRILQNTAFLCGLEPPDDLARNVSMLGIGSYKARDTLSYVWTPEYTYRYTERNIASDPHYFLIGQTNFFIALRRKIAALENLLSQANHLILFKHIDIVSRHRGSEPPEICLSVDADYFGTSEQNTYCQRIINNFC
jgi:hypothetical protein